MERFFSLLMQISIISSALVLVVLTIDKLLGKRINLKIMMFLWIIVLIRLIIPAFISLPIDLYTLIPERSAVHITEVIDSIKASQIFDYNIQPADYAGTTNIHNSTDNYSDDDTETNANNQHGIIAKIIKYFKKVSIFTYAIFIWCLGAVFAAVKKLYAGYKFSKIIADDEKIKLKETMDECRRRLNFDKKISVKKSKFIAAPITYGIVNPTILLPENIIEKISQKKLLMILMHEVSHIKRKDIIKNFFWLIAKILHWYNPLVYMAYKQYLMNVELSCDQMVVNNISADERFEYSQTLIDVIKMSNSVSLAKPPSGVSFCECNTKIKRRVEKMLNSKKQIKSAGIITIVFAFILIFCCFTTACLPVKDNSVSDTVPEETISEEVLNAEEQATDDINTYESDTVTISDEFCILDMYDTDGNSTCIMGSKNAKKATEIAKEAIRDEYNVSCYNLMLKEIDDISSDETMFQVVVEDKKNNIYTVAVKVSINQVESITYKETN